MVTEMKDNIMELRFKALPENEAFARMVISAFIVQKNPPLSIISEVRTAISEAVTNVIVHSGSEMAVVRAEFINENVCIEVEDFGCGICDVQQAMQPFYTSQPDQERTGIGFALMQSFMDSVSVISSPDEGTLVKMTKRLTL